MALGDFTQTAVPIRKQMLKVAWADAQANKKLALEKNTLEAMITQTTASFGETLRLPNNCLGIDLMFLETNCANNATTVTVSGGLGNTNNFPCDIAGVQTSSSKVQYKMRSMVAVEFFVKEDECENYFGAKSKVEILSMQADRDILAKLNTATVLALSTFAGSNPFNAVTGIPQNLGQGQLVSASPTLIPSGNMNPRDISTYIQMMSSYNRMKDPILLTGGQFMGEEIHAKAGRGTDIGMVQNHYLDALNIKSDIRGFMANSITNKMFLIEKGSVAFVSKTVNSNEPTIIPGTFQMKWKEPLFAVDDLESFQGLEKDVYYMPKKVEIGGGRCVIEHHYRYEMYYDLFINPQLCANGLTGVIDLTFDPTSAQMCMPAPCGQIGGAGSYIASGL